MAKKTSRASVSVYPQHWQFPSSIPSTQKKNNSAIIKSTKHYIGLFVTWCPWCCIFPWQKLKFHKIDFKGFYGRFDLLGDINTAFQAALDTARRPSTKRRPPESEKQHQWIAFHTQMLNVWNIYLHIPPKLPKCIGKLDHTLNIWDWVFLIDSFWILENWKCLVWHPKSWSIIILLDWLLLFAGPEVFVRLFLAKIMA